MKSSFPKGVRSILMKIELPISLDRTAFKLFTQWIFAQDNPCKLNYCKFKFVFPIESVYKSCQRNMFSSKVPKVDLTPFGTELFKSNRIISKLSLMIELSVSRGGMNGAFILSSYSRRPWPRFTKNCLRLISSFIHDLPWVGIHIDRTIEINRSSMARRVQNMLLIVCL